MCTLIMLAGLLMASAEQEHPVIRAGITALRSGQVWEAKKLLEAGDAAEVARALRYEYEKKDKLIDAARFMTYQIIVDMDASGSSDGYRILLAGIGDPAGGALCMRALHGVSGERAKEVASRVARELESALKQKEWKAVPRSKSELPDPMATTQVQTIATALEVLRPWLGNEIVAQDAAESVMHFVEAEEGPSELLLPAYTFVSAFFIATGKENQIVSWLSARAQKGSHRMEIVAAIATVRKESQLAPSTNGALRDCGVDLLRHALAEGEEAERARALSGIVILFDSETFSRQQSGKFIVNPVVREMIEWVRDSDGSLAIRNSAKELLESIEHRVDKSH